MTVTIDTSALDSFEAENYFTKNDHRMAAFRGALELLAIPLPGWAMRKPSGRKPSVSVAKAYEADNPTPKLGGGTLLPRKPNATPERIAEIKAKREGNSLSDRIAALKNSAPSDDPLNGLFS